MAYTTFPATTRAGAPSATDDSSKGFVRGSIIVDTTTNPDAPYVCVDSTVGAAVWVPAGGGVTSHPALTTLGWSASGHTGTQSSVACFNAAGAAQTVQAVEDGSTLTFKDGVLQFLVVAAAAAVVNQSAKSIDVEFIASNTAYTIVLDDAIVAPGSFV
jgi:hypothetical protein